MLFRLLFHIFVCYILSGISLAVAFEEINTGYFNNLALKGYDTAKYFTDRSAFEGLKTHSFHWKGTEWRFADAASRDLFAASPGAYAPQFGGYCSNQMSLGNLSGIDPGVWLIFAGKLYFFGHQEGKDRWEKTGIADRIADANRHWKDYLASKD